LKKLPWANLKATLLAYFQGLFREKLTAARTYWVRTDGSDSNDGLANTSGSAFLTVQKAIDVASALDNGGFNITIQLGNGTYSAGASLKSFVGSGRIVIQGNSTTPANVHVSVASGNVVAGVSVIGVYEISYMKLTSAAAGKPFWRDDERSFAGQRIWIGRRRYGLRTRIGAEQCQR
jgi:pectin methylesterase-like acyl-CoA thioesterase